MHLFISIDGACEVPNFIDLGQKVIKHHKTSKRLTNEQLVYVIISLIYLHLSKIDLPRMKTMGYSKTRRFSFSISNLKNLGFKTAQLEKQRALSI